MHAAVLRYLDAVAEEGSIRRAAERLHVSPSAVNRQILKLEARIGTPLFERHAGGMRLTEAGELVVGHARGTLQDYARLLGDVAQKRGVISGTVRIATLDSLTVQFLPDALARFSDDHPLVQVRVTSTDPMGAVNMVLRGAADLALTFGSEPPGAEILQEMPAPMCAIMAPEHPLSGRAAVTLEDCAEHALIYQDETGSIQPFLGSEMEAFKRAHDPIIVSNTLALAKRLLLRGVGMAFYTRLGFVEELAEGRLVAVPLAAERSESLRLALIAPSDRVPTVAGRTMAEHLADALIRFSERTV